MGRPVTVQAGPFIAASTTQIALAQNVLANGAIVLNGVGGTFTANSIALSQSLAGAVAVTLNGALASGTPAAAYPSGGVGPIYITSAGNDSGITFAIVGLDKTDVAIQTETLTGANAGVVASLKNYYKIISITSSGATAAAITVGTFLPVKLDKPRRVLITTASTIAFKISGTDWAGDPISETVTNAGASVSSVLDYASVTSVVAASNGTSVSIGTSGVGASPWIRMDEWAAAPTVLQCDVSGTVNYTVQFSNDDPNSATNAVAPSAMTWFSSTDTGVVGVAIAAASSFAYTPLFMRLLLNSGSGSATMLAYQFGGKV